MSGKRTATSDLNHENWDREEDKEEAGTFRRADPEELKSRPIKIAMRRKPPESTIIEDKPSGAFQRLASTVNTNKVVSTGFSFLNPTLGNNLNGGLGKQANLNPNSAFSFLNQSLSNIANGGFQKQADDTPKLLAVKDDTSNTMKVSHTITSPESRKTLDSASNANTPAQFWLGTAPNTPETGLTGFGTITKPLGNTTSDEANIEESTTTINTLTAECSSTARSEKFLTEMKEINFAFLQWVTDELGKRPLSILTRCFKDYIQHIQKLFDEEKLLPLTPEQRLVLEVQERVLNELTPKQELLICENQQENKEENKEGVNSPTVTLVDSQQDRVEDDGNGVYVPPKPDFEEVEEEGAVFSKRVKVFVKDSEDKYENHGIGTLFLKPVLDGSKTQLIVRASTALGNILVNTLVTPDTPVAPCKDSNNVVIVCIPMPDAKPPPRPVLFKLKTREDADELVSVLNKCKN